MLTLVTQCETNDEMYKWFVLLEIFTSPTRIG